MPLSRIATILLLFSFSLQAKERLTLAAPGDKVAEVSKEILLYAYKQIGISIDIVTLPAERALLWSNSGFYDGEIIRIAEVEKMYPNLVRIPVAINKFEAMVFTKRKDVVVQGWDSLRPYSILLKIGIKFAEIGTKGMNAKSFPRNEDVFNELHRGKYDIAITTRLTGMSEIKRLALTDIQVIEPPLAEYKLYHYLNKKHDSIIPKITLKLKEMEKNGMIEKIRQKYMAQALLR